MYIAIKYAVVTTALLTLVACGGGGGSSPSPTANRWLANEGTYIGCNGHEKTTVTFSAVGTNQATTSYRKDVYDGDLCTGVVVGTYLAPLPLTITYQDSVVANVTGIGASAQSVSVDRVVVSSPAMTVSLTGSGVQGLCVNYPNGNICYNSLIIPAATVNSAAYISSSSFASLTATSAGYSVDQPLLLKQGNSTSSSSAALPIPSASVPAALQPLIGRITLNYKFNLFSTIYSNTSDYLPSSLSSDSTSLIATSAPMGIMTCGLAPAVTGKQYMCLMIIHSWAIDAFLKDVSWGLICGYYTYCLAGVTTSACATNMLLSPSGTVTGSVVALAGGIEVLPISVNALNVDSIEPSKGFANAQMSMPQVIPSEAQPLVDLLDSRLVGMYINANAKK